MLFEMSTAEAEAMEWALFVANAAVEDDPSLVSTRDLVTRVQGILCRLSTKLSSVAEGFPVKQLDYNAKSRFFVVKGSLSAHCCFGYTVCDRTKPDMINGKHYKNQYETVCECFEEEEAILVCLALNACWPEVK